MLCYFFLYIILYTFASLTTTDSKPICQRQIVIIQVLLTFDFAIGLEKYVTDTGLLRQQYVIQTSGIHFKTTVARGPDGKQDNKRNKEQVDKY